MADMAGISCSRRSKHHNTLLHFRFNPEHTAERGRHGEGSNRTGKDGADVEVPVPVGTVVYDADTGEQLFDFASPDDVGLRRRADAAAKAMRALRHRPIRRRRSTKKASRANWFKLKLELKLLADVGLVGFPNAGKSTLISRLSAAKPKIADYPFTTLEPNLGVVQAGDHTFVMADIPGLIEGAHEGHGLGIQFLRHVERTKLLVHLVDVSEFSGREPAHDFDVILGELREFSEAMLEKPMIVVASKIDACQDPSRIEAVGRRQRNMGRLSLRFRALRVRGLKNCGLR